MLKAIENAKKAFELDEAPIGAIIVCNDRIIAEAYNQKEAKNCAIYHAEIEVIAKACETMGNWRLYGCDIYCTLEPCAMCSGAIINSRLDRVFFGAYDSKAGCMGSLYNFSEDRKFNHHTEVFGGIMEKECGELLSEFFKKKRKSKKS